MLERCRVLDKLATERFISRDHTCLRESFHGDWSVAPAEGEGRVEPGHLMEWAWLLARFETHAQVDRSDFIQPLIATALTRGTDRARGRIIDEFIEDGRGQTLSSRSWPHGRGLQGSRQRDPARAHRLRAGSHPHRAAPARHALPDRPERRLESIASTLTRSL